MCQTTAVVTALVLKFSGAQWGIDFLPDDKHLSAFDKSAFADILSESALSHA